MGKSTKEKENSGEGCVEGVFVRSSDRREPIGARPPATVFVILISPKACLHPEYCIFVGLYTLWNAFLTLLRFNGIPFPDYPGALARRRLHSKLYATPAPSYGHNTTSIRPSKCYFDTTRLDTTVDFSRSVAHLAILDRSLGPT